MTDTTAADHGEMLDDGDDDQLLPDVSTTAMDSSSDEDPPKNTGDPEPAEEDLTVGLTLAECVDKANEHKAAGNEHFKAQRCREAVGCYKMGVRYLSKHSDEAEARPVLVALHTNSAACHIKDEAWSEAVAAADESLKIDLTHKALYRRGLAYARLGSLECAGLRFELRGLTAGACCAHALRHDMC
jgi:tetratricopeptide (TPR) repeat protein